MKRTDWADTCRMERRKEQRGRMVAAIPRIAIHLGLFRIWVYVRVRFATHIDVNGTSIPFVQCKSISFFLFKAFIC